MSEQLHEKPWRCRRGSAPLREARGRGFTLLYAMVALTVLFGLISLAVDFGRVQVVKTELQRAADAAARYAATGVADDTHVAKAQAVALENQADNSPVVLLSTDVQKGNWNSSLTPRFSPSRSPVNAVQITARRAASRGTGVPTVFMRVFGWNTCDVSATSICMTQTNAYPFGAIGLDWVQMDSNSTTDSYDSRIGAYHSGHTPDIGSIASNGSIQLAGGVTVRGDARPGPGKVASGGTVTGNRVALEASMSFAAPVASGSFNNAAVPAAYKSGSDFILDSATYTLPAGTYSFTNFTLKNNAVLNVDGTATIYISGFLHIDGDARTGSHRPKRLRFRVTGSGSVSLDGNNGVWADLYAPLSNVVLDSNKRFYGAIVARTLSIDSNARLHVDEALLEEGDTYVVLVD